MNIEICEATISDLPSVLLLYSHLGMDDGNVLALKDAKKIFNKIKKYPNYKIFTGKMNKEIIGTFALLIIDNIGHMGAPSGLIEDLVVHPEYKRKGIGKLMVNFALDYCRNMGCYKAALSSNINREDAHAFYKALGFRLHGYSFMVDLLEDKK